MKRGVKIGLIAIGSLLALVAAVVSLVCWLVFTPARLTGIVDKVASKYLTCDMEVGEVDLTLFGTFPDVSLQLSDVVLINQVDSASNDTVAAIAHCAAVLDLGALLHDTTVVLRSLQLDGGRVNLYTTADGIANYMVFPTDTLTEEKESDTIAIDMPDIDIQEIYIHDVCVDYQDVASGQRAAIEGLTAHVSGQMVEERLAAVLDVSLRRAALNTKGESVMNACVEDANLTMDGALHGTDAKVGLMFKAACVDGLIADMEARVEQMECTFNGTGKDGLWVGTTMLTTRPVAAKINGESPMEAVLGGARLEADAKLHGKDIALSPSLVLPSLTVDVGGERMFDKADIQLQGDLLTDTLLKSVSLVGGLLALNEHEITLNGQVEMPDTSTICADIDFATNRWDIARLLALVPRGYRHLLEGIDVSGGVALKGKGNGSLIGGEPHIGNVDATLSLDGIDLLYDDSIALQSHKADVSVAYNGRKDRVAGHLSSDVLDVSVKGLADAQLHGMDGDFTVRQPMRIVDGYIDATANMAMNSLSAAMDTLEIYTEGAAMDISLSGSEKTKPQFDAVLRLDTMNTAMGTLLTASTGTLGISAQAIYDKAADNLLAQWNPQLAFDVQDGNVASSMLTVPVAIPNIQFDYADGRFTINDSRILLGNSDFGLRGDVHNIDSFVNKTGLLKAELDFSSAYTDVTQLMDLVSGLGVDDTADMVNEEAVEMEKADDDPFMVPLGIDVKLNTDIRTVNVNGFKFDDIGGNVSVKDGVLVLEEMGFTSDAARMQLTAMYKSPRRNHLFVGFDFHLLDIEIDELIHMIPDVDSIIPMLSAFDGEAEFHFAAETYLKSNYDIKMSTLRAAGAIEGKDLVVMDSETFEKISKYLFKEDTPNVVDSVSVELTVFKDEVDLYPFLIAMDKYKAIIGGRHNINEDLDFNYHISLASPLRLGLDIKGSLDDVKLVPVPCKYAQMYNPKKQNAVQARTLQLKKMISDSLKDNVKPQASRD